MSNSRLQGSYRCKRQDVMDKILRMTLTVMNCLRILFTVDTAGLTELLHEPCSRRAAVTAKEKDYHHFIPLSPELLIHWMCLPPTYTYCPFDQVQLTISAFCRCPITDWSPSPSPSMERDHRKTTTDQICWQSALSTAVALTR